MEPTAQEVAAAVSRAAGNEMDAAVRKIKHCAKQLSEEQMWWRPAASMNSIANLILHLCGNVRQWITCGIGGTKDTRDRPREFSEQGPIAEDELLARLDAAVAEARVALDGASPSDLLEERHVQQFYVTGLGAIVDSVSHLRGHTQEIIHMTRCQLGNDYVFDFVPKSVGDELSP